MKKIKVHEQFSNFLSNIDLFAKPATFRIFQKDRFTTKLGLFFTLVIALALALSFAYFLNDLLESASPSVVQTDYSSINTPATVLMPANFTLAISLVDLNLITLTTLGSVYTMQVQNCKRTRKMNSTTGQVKAILNCYNYTVEPCNINTHFPTQEQKAYFSSFNMINIYCVNYDEWMTRPLQIQGTAQSLVYQYVQVLIDKCKNSVNCSSQEIMNKELYGYYAVHLSDNLIQMNKINEPFKQVINMQYSIFSNSTSKDIFDFRREVVTQTDNGIIFSDWKENSTIIQSSFQESQALYNDRYLISHGVIFDIRYSLYSRSYQKLQQLLGTIGGLYQVMYLMLMLLISPIVTFIMKLSIIARIFKFQIKGNNTKENKQTIFRTSQKHCNIHDQKNIDKFLKYNNKSLALSLRQLIFIFCGCRKKEKEMIDYANMKIQKRLDLEFILTKLLEIDKLKTIILSKDQQSLFNYMSKPLITEDLFESGNLQRLEGHPQYQYILSEEKSDLVKLTQAFDAFEKMKESQFEIDKRLVNHLDYEILELFYHMSGQNFINTIPLANSWVSNPNLEMLRQNPQEIMLPHTENKNGRTIAYDDSLRQS